MTPEQRQELVDFLRTLAEWLEDGEQLEECTRGKWNPLSENQWAGLRSWVGKIRVTPKPIERWLVLVPAGDCEFTNEADAKRFFENNHGLRIVHLREVEE